MSTSLDERLTRLGAWLDDATERHLATRATTHRSPRRRPTRRQLLVAVIALGAAAITLGLSMLGDEQNDNRDRGVVATTPPTTLVTPRDWIVTSPVVPPSSGPTPTTSPTPITPPPGQTPPPILQREAGGPVGSALAHLLAQVFGDAADLINTEDQFVAGEPTRVGYATFDLEGSSVEATVQQLPGPIPLGLLTYAADQSSLDRTGTGSQLLRIVKFGLAEIRLARPSGVMLTLSSQAISAPRGLGIDQLVAIATRLDTPALDRVPQAH